MLNSVLHAIQMWKLGVEEVDNVGFASDCRARGKCQNAVISIKFGDGEIGVQGVHMFVEFLEPFYGLSMLVLSRHFGNAGYNHGGERL